MADAPTLRNEGDGSKRAVHGVRRCVYFPVDEWDVLARRMIEYGETNFSRFTRQMLLNNGRFCVSNHDELVEVFRFQFSRIGNNLNQIARKANTEDEASVELLQQCLRLLSEIKFFVDSRLDARVCCGHDEDFTDQERCSSCG
ncbi:MAG: MobC family plasmid mobilization relaxosome protein [Arcanobacterium sp.]|nr:MobC family plasmid mobilization relaxosome protein [Arcanobacterium sp.]